VNGALAAAAGIVVLAALVVSGIAPYHRGTWLLEVAPVLIAAPILVGTWRRFPLSDLLYLLIAIHALVLIAGGAYTYARVPLGYWLQDWMHLARNPYDRLGHFMQGLVPALAAREILLRGRYVSGRRMAAFLSICVAMAVSAGYELLEWAAAVALGQGADEFLGTQGDPWDTQWDMFMALVGSVVAMLGFARLHDARMRGMRPPSPRPSPKGEGEPWRPSPKGEGGLWRTSPEREASVK
jgi:putative membrane protein